MEERKDEDFLREQYFKSLPEIRRVVEQLEAEIRYRILPIQHQLKDHEQIVIKSRIKDCESSLKAVLRRMEGRTIEPDYAQTLSILSLKDLAGVRVLAFPRSRLDEIDRLLKTCTCVFKPCRCLASWSSDPIPYQNGSENAPKYWGYCADASSTILAEYQIVPMLIGLFWEVEHSALYKPSPEIKASANSKEMKDERAAVETALSNFENKFKKLVLDESSSST